MAVNDHAHTPFGERCVCRRCTPPFTHFVEGAEMTGLDLLVKLEELGLSMASDGVVLFMMTTPHAIPELVAQLETRIRVAVEKHRHWLRKHLRRTPSKLLRMLMGPEAYEENYRKNLRDQSMHEATHGS